MRQLLVYGDRTFKISIPDSAKVTFGPFSPPTKKNPWNGNEERAHGTLRVYLGRDQIIGCFAGVRGFRDTSLEYLEEVTREEGAVIWKSDEHGYKREEKVAQSQAWEVRVDEVPALPAPKRKKRRQ